MSSQPSKAELGWRTPILKHFDPGIATTAPLTVVSDPDHLLLETEVLEQIRDSGFELLTYEDPITFRFECESHFRKHWDSSEASGPALVLRSPKKNLKGLPFDLLTRAQSDGRLLSFSLAELFPGFSPGIVAELDRKDLDELFATVRTHKPENLGENLTRDFILLHVFRVAPELITNAVELLKLLLDRHYKMRELPATLDQRIIQKLRTQKELRDWPLEEIVPSRSAFFKFLEERWPFFVKTQISPDPQITDGLLADESLVFPGPAYLPFDQDSIRVYIDNLFTEGLLAPTDQVPKSQVEAQWMRFGVAGDEPADALERFQRLTETVSSALPSEDCLWGDWTEFAYRWAEWIELWSQVPQEHWEPDENSLEKLSSDVGSAFLEWMTNHYASLYSHSYIPTPPMVHQILFSMAHGWDGKERLALVVVDGLALAQWAAIRPRLRQNQPTWRIEEAACFAWVPTLTPVSRQAIFAAKIPHLFGPTVHTTSKEPGHWRRFWEERDVSPSQVFFLKQGHDQPDESFLSGVVETTGGPNCRLIAIVVGTVDQMLHGNPTGTRGFQAQIRHWAGEGHLERLLSELIGAGFRVFLTSDHGNIEATGCGKPNEGATSEERGQRVRVFPNETLRSQVEANFPAAVPWPPVGLPDDYLPLLAPQGRAFVTAGSRIVGHGGLSLEEVIVPFVVLDGRE